MKKTAIAILVLLLAAGLAFSQSWRGKGRLKGTVTDEQGTPLEGVTVKMYSLRGESGFEISTNSRGEWTASYIRGGGWNIDFEKPGYEPRRISTSIQEKTNNPAIDISLKKAEGLMVTDEIKAELNSGNTLFEEGKYDLALEAFEDLVARNPGLYVLYKNIGNCYFALEQYDKAEEAYRKVLEKEPGNPDILVLIGNCYANRNEPEKAMEWYDKVEFEKISDPTVLYNIGTMFTRQSKFDEALKYYKRAVTLKPDFTDALYELGLTYLALGRNAEAAGPFEDYLKADPDSGRADQVRKFLEFLKKKGP